MDKWIEDLRPDDGREAADIAPSVAGSGPPDSGGDSVATGLSPPVEAREPTAIAAAVLAAVNDRDRGSLVALLDGDSEVITGRGIHAGADEIVAWACKEFDHLFRRFAIDQIREGPSSLLALGFVEHVWSESGEVADRTSVALELIVDDMHLRILRVHDDAAAALAGFEA